jgi:hypothetical protein
MDESDVQLPFRPEPIGIHPQAYYGRREREYRDRDYYQDEYRRRPGPEYEYEYRRHRDRDYLEGSRYGGMYSSMNRGMYSKCDCIRIILYFTIIIVVHFL